jgi:PAS domain-containing protein
MIALPDKSIDTDDGDAHLQFVFLQALVDQMSEPALIGVPGTTDGSGTIVYANQSSAEQLDCSFNELIGKPLPHLMQPSARLGLAAASHAKVDRFTSSRFATQWSRSPADFAGEWRTALFRDSAGTSRYVVCVLAEPA